MELTTKDGNLSLLYLRYLISQKPSHQLSWPHYIALLRQFYMIYLKGATLSHFFKLFPD
jgi:hypothetical protein